MKHKISAINYFNYELYADLDQCEDIEFVDIDYMDASSPEEEASRLLRFCHVTCELRCDVHEIAESAEEQEKAALLASNARCGREVVEMVLYSSSLLLIVAVIVTNALLATVIAKHRSLRSPTNKIIMSLAISDIIFALSSIYSEVMNILQTAAEMNYNYDRLENIISIRSIKQLCLLLDGPGLIYASMLASVLTLTCVATEKYIAIFHPFKYYSVVTKKNLILCTVVIWSVSIFMGLLPLLWNTFDGTCLMVEKTSYGYIILWASICMSCAVVMATMYTRILYTARKQARAINARQVMFTCQASHSTAKPLHFRRSLSESVLRRKFIFNSKTNITAPSESGIYTTKSSAVNLCLPTPTAATGGTKVCNKTKDRRRVAKVNPAETTRYSNDAESQRMNLTESGTSTSFCLKDSSYVQQEIRVHSKTATQTQPEIQGTSMPGTTQQGSLYEESENQENKFQNLLTTSTRRSEGQSVVGWAGTTQSGDGSPGTTQSGDGSPGSAQSGDGSPGSAQSGDGSPGTTQSRDGSSGTAQSGDGSPGTTHSGDGSPGSAQSRDGSPGTTQSGDGSPGTAQSGDGSPGSAHSGRPSESCSAKPNQNAREGLTNNSCDTATTTTSVRSLKNNRIAPLLRASTVNHIHLESCSTSSESKEKTAALRRTAVASASRQKLFPPSVRAIKTIAVILGAFYICWMPLLIYILAFKNRYSNFIFYILATFALMNSLLNPLIYGFKNRGIRSAVRRLLHCSSLRRGSLAFETAYNVNH